jgi:glucose-6-phosphate 1-dehydrogenase
MRAKRIGTTVIVIFGITGDLARRKLIPALFDLSREGMLPDEVQIVGFSRRAFTETAFREFVTDALHRSAKEDPALVEVFVRKFSYCQAAYDEQKSYALLGDYLRTLETNIGSSTNRLFYLAVPPHLYTTIFEHLAASGLADRRPDEEGWARILVEKPFGRDLRTARKLDELVGRLFKEEQIFRIDHYLAKETVQNIIMFRFSNTLFEPSWNKKSIERVEIRLHEAGDAGGRGAFFDAVGTLRDVGQNHLLQMLAVVAMERPPTYTALHVRAVRAAVLGKVRAKPGAVRGQYQGYRSEAGVAPGSETETYFRVVAEIDNKRWRGVPFMLEAGKALAETKAEIVLYFKHPEPCLSQEQGARCEHINTLTFRIQPDEGIRFTFWVTKPGPTNELEAKDLSFSYLASPDAVRLPDAYERLIYDALLGDQTLFASTKEVHAGWKFVEKVLKEWQQGSVPLHYYRPGETISK